MRLPAILICCLALVACSTPPPDAQVTQAADKRLDGLRNFQLMPPENAVDALPYASRYPLLNAWLRQGLERQGYRESGQAQLRIYYWLALRDAALEFKADVPPPQSLGPYLAIHRLPDQTGTLRVRLTDLHDQVLWEGTVSTGLSPQRTSSERLRHAVDALVAQVPKAAP